MQGGCTPEIGEEGRVDIEPAELGGIEERGGYEEAKGDGYDEVERLG